MNCFEFRKHCVAEPRSQAPEYRRHRAECAGCAAFADEQERFERALERAVQVDVPPGLGARVLLRQTTRRAFWSRRLLAYAASVLVAIAVAFALVRAPETEAIDAFVIHHVMSEPEMLMAEDEVPSARAAELLAHAGATLVGDIGILRAAARCPGDLGVHLVLAGSRGPVTVFFMPTKPVAGRQWLARDGFTGVVLPAGAGSLAIVGFPGEPIAEHEQRVRRAISVNV